MSRFTDELYRRWLRQNAGAAGGGQAQRRTPEAGSRGMGQRPMVILSRPECPMAQGAVSPGRPRHQSAGAMHPPALPVPGHSPALLPRGAEDNAQPALPARHEKQDLGVSDYVDNS